ncbi:MAG: imidazole glycerol phosphate synthase subunit HisH [Clostridia bacterium]|nr:imidazole glycerol phosphate synthase subunit HisH [Clostridia bacterium]
MLAIVDYGVGNLYSLASSLKCIGAEHVIAARPEQLRSASHIILPGVGAFADAARKLRQSGMRDALLEEVRSGKPLLGICLGMQMLFEKSYEYGEHEGLGLIPGRVCPLADDIAPGLKVPHIGWNRLDIVRDDPLFRYFENGRHVYYVHSFYAKNCAEFTLAASDYSIPVTGVVRNGNVYGAQFHPEKSGEAGLNLLRAFAEMEEAT